MRRPFTDNSPSAFPTNDPEVYWEYLAAPFWSNSDLRQEGSVTWEIHTSDVQTNNVSNFIQDEYGDTVFNGTWMMVVQWKNLHPYPHGEDGTSVYSQKVCDTSLQ